jgi:outer membrane protein assembly factor BamA
VTQIKKNGPALAGVFIFSIAMAAQDKVATESTREGSIAAQEAEKARSAQPLPRDKVEEWVLKAEKILLLEPAGFFPYFDSVYPGGSLTGGAGYRQFYGDKSSWEIKGLYSVLNYKLIEGSTVSRDHWKGKLTFGGRVGWRDATQVGYYGLGMNTSKDDRANFRFQETYLDGHALYRPVWWIPIRGSVGYEHWNTLQAEGDEPSIETKYTPATAPGLGADPSYIHSAVSAGIDWRRSPLYARRGGLYGLTFHDYQNTGGGLYSFQRLDGEVIQHLPILRDTWVLAGRARVQTTLNDNDLIPYFLLPSLGGGNTLRGYSTDRFRDRNSLLVNAEFRWLPSPGLDMALFYDAGKVASRRSDLDFSSMKSDVGIGVRFHTPLATVLRVDVAVSNEGWHFVFGGGPAF